MPKFKLTEIDNTGSPTLNPITNVVYIPGKASAKTNPLMCNTLNDLETYANATINGKVNPDYKGLEKDLSYKLAKRCLQLGMQVLYQGFTGNSATSTFVEGEYSASIVEIEDESHVKTKMVTISGEAFTYDEENHKLITVEKYGSPKAHLEFAIANGTCTIDSQYLFIGVDETHPSTAIKHAQTVLFDYVNEKVGYNWLGTKSGGITMSDSDWSVLSDKALYDIRFLTTGAYALPSQSMIACAKKRGDAVALIDHAKGETLVATIRGTLEQFGGEDGKFAAAFTPWWTSNVDDFGSELIPPSFGYLFAYARSIQNNPDWYAVAGTFRGAIPELKKLQKDYSTAEIEILQGRGPNAEVELDGEGDNTGIAINPIAYIRGFGYLIWGNRTLITNAGYTKATSFLNVRNLCSDIVKTLYAAARRYTFEQNSNTLWLNFKHQVQPLLDRMVSGNGILSYTFEQLPTTAKARLKARISITPIEGVEDFELELYLEDSLEVIE